MSQEANNSDTVSTAQTTENHDQTEAKTTIRGDQSTLTFGGQDGTEKSTNAQASFDDYDDREIDQETIPPHCQIQAPPIPGEQSKTLTLPEGKGNSKGRGRNQSNTNQSRGRGNGQKNQGNAGKRHDGKKTNEKGKVRWKQPVCHYCEKQGHIRRGCPKKIADVTTTNTTTNSSQQLIIEDDLDILFQNEEVSINKQTIPNQNNVFALLLDLNTGLVFVFPSPSRGLAGTALLAYTQRYGQPLTVRHDNAQEFIAGEFADICNKNGIQQNRSAPFNPNQNPVEQYMDLLMSKTRCLLATSGLDPATYWELALEHSATLTNLTALPGRCTPSEYNFGKRPDISNLWIF